MMSMTAIQWLRGAAAVAALAGALPGRAAANQPPQVTVGDDTVCAGTRSVVYLIAEVNDDSTAYDSLRMQWSQIQGPAPAQILLPASATTRVAFTDSGLYRFELRVSDGTLSSSDTVVIHVRVSLPFVITHPSDGEPIPVGRPCTIRWQMDPSLACTVWFTLDNGLTWTQINTWGAEMDSCVWDVPAGLASGTRGCIKVHEYQNDTNAAVSGGEFLLVDPAQSARQAPKAPMPEYPAVLVDKQGNVRPSGPAVFSHIDVFALDGRMAPASTHPARSVAFWRLRGEADPRSRHHGIDATGAVPR